MSRDSGEAKVTASLYTTLGGKIVKETTHVEAANLAELLEALASKYGREFREEIYDGGEIKNYYIVLHNGNFVDRRNPGGAALAGGDTVHIFPPVSGG